MRTKQTILAISTLSACLLFIALQVNVGEGDLATVSGQITRTQSGAQATSQMESRAAASSDLDQEATRSETSPLISTGAILRPLPGVRFHHDLSAQSSTRISLAGQGQTVDISLKGELVISVLGEKEGVKVLGLRVRDAVLSANADGQQTDPSSEEEFSKRALQLNDDSLVQLDANGRAVGVLPAEGIGEVATQWVRALAAQLQLDQPEGAKRSWQTIQSDGTGEVLVEYQELGTESVTQREFNRRRLNYTHELGQEDVPVSPNLSGSTRLSVSLADGWFIDLNADEVTELNISSQEFSATASVKIHINRTKVEPCDPLTDEEVERLLAQKWLPITASTETDSGSSYASRSGEDLSDQTISSLLAEIEALVASGEIGSYELYQARRKFARFIKRYPGSLSELRMQLLSGSYDDVTVGTAIGAVGSSRAEGAIEWLTGLALEATAGTNLRLSTLVSLSQIQEPTPALLLALSAMAQDPGLDPTLGSSALLVLGAMARYDETDVALKQLLELEELSIERGVRAWLEALANAQTPATGEAALPYLTHESAAVRAAAIDATLGMGPEAALTYALSALSDPEFIVRSSGASIVFEHAPLTEVGELVINLNQEPSNVVRGDAYRALASRTDGEGHSLLLQCLNSETNADLLALIESLTE